MGERLREVAEVAAALGVDLLGIELQRAREREQLLAERSSALRLADLGERGDEPERADGGGALFTLEAVVGVLHAVAKHETVLGQLVGDREDRLADALVVGRQESHERE